MKRVLTSKLARMLLIAVIPPFAVSCFSGPDTAGAAHASREQVIGTYRNGAVTIELRPDGKYSQSVTGPQPTVNAGTWTIENDFFRNTTIILKDGSDQSGKRWTELNLDVYRIAGSLVLMENASADYYYSKVK